MSDKINHPDHYTAGSIEVYDFIEAWNLDFTIGNVVKYVARAPYKGTQLDDLRKAKWYLEKAIEKEERRIAERVTASLDNNAMNMAGSSSPAGISAWIKSQYEIDRIAMNERMYLADIENAKQMKISKINLLGDVKY